MILQVSDTRQQDSKLAKHYQYGIDLKTGEVKENLLLIEMEDRLNSSIYAVHIKMNTVFYQAMPLKQ